MENKAEAELSPPPPQNPDTELSTTATSFAAVESCFILGDVTYGACCVDDLSAAALSADLLIHYGHSCLVPIDNTSIPCLYVFVDIKINVNRLIETVQLNFDSFIHKQIVLVGTIQFANAIRAAKPDLETLGFKVFFFLGCTAPSVCITPPFDLHREPLIPEDKTRADEEDGCVPRRSL
ncbi:unnamed protein product [Camellia sinensis]